MASADQIERNLVRNAGVVTYNPLRDSSTTNLTRDAGLAGYGSAGTTYKLPGENNPYSSIPTGPGALTDTQVASIVSSNANSGKSNNSSNDLTTMMMKLLGGSGRSSGSSAANILDRDKFNYLKKQDEYNNATALEALNFGRAKDARALSGMENYYTSGQYGTGFDKLLGMIDAQGKVSEKGVTDAYGRAVTNIDEGYGAAQGLGDAGYAALNQYLGQNPNNPYAGMQASVGSAPDALTQYLSSYGVSDQPVQGQIQADQLQAQQGAGNYQNLINILSGVAQSGASSRGAESAMGQNLFNTSLGQEQAGYKGAANNAQAQALAALQQQMFQSRFGVENDRNSLANQLAQAIVAAGGTVGGTTNTDTNTDTDTDTNTNTTSFAPSTSYDVNRPVPTVQQANLIRNMPGQDLNELFQMLNARRGY